MEERHDGFLGKLDWSFSRMLVPRLIRWLYVILLALVTLGWIVFVFVGPLPIWAAIFVAPVGWVMHVVLVRIQCELVIVIFKINEQLTDAVAALRGRSGPGMSQPPPT